MTIEIPDDIDRVYLQAILRTVRDKIMESPKKDLHPAAGVISTLVGSLSDKSDVQLLQHVAVFSGQRIAAIKSAEN